MSSMNAAGTALTSQGRLVRRSHTVTVSSVSAASNWFEVPNRVQNTRQAGTTWPAASLTTQLTLIAGIAQASALFVSLFLTQRIVESQKWR